MHSRNRRAGILIGQGKTPREAMEEVGAYFLHGLPGRFALANEDARPAIPGVHGRCV